MDPHVLAVQEVGDPGSPAGKLADRVGGTWHIETAAIRRPEPITAIRVGSPVAGCH